MGEQGGAVGALTWLSDIENKKESSGEGNIGAGSGEFLPGAIGQKVCVPATKRHK